MIAEMRYPVTTGQDLVTQQEVPFLMPARGMGAYGHRQMTKRTLAMTARIIDHCQKVQALPMFHVMPLR